MIMSAVLIYVIASASAQITEIREYRGSLISCSLSGLRLWGSPCGTDGGYAYIFVGSVLSTTDISDTEKHLSLEPQEMFLGDAVTRLAATTNQGACLPEIVPGDKWLFYLKRDDKTHELVLDYGSPSGPVTRSQPVIGMLRRLTSMTDSGIILGSLEREVEHVDPDGAKWSDSVPVPNHKVIAKRLSDGAEYSARSDSAGDFQLAPLPSGSYHLSTNTAQGLWAEEDAATVHARGCTRFQFELHADGVISGQVRSADGEPFDIHPWVEVQSEDGEHFESFYTDELGNFEARGLEPGRYVVGIGMRAESDSSEWRSRVYYPGVRTKEEAAVVELRKAEKRTNIDFPVSIAEPR
jgi:hypothetical protein